MGSKRGFLHRFTEGWEIYYVLTLLYFIYMTEFFISSVLRRFV